MRVGIDFDNTIVSYDELFHKVAVEQAAVPSHTPVQKLAVREYLRKAGREDAWTAMQGYVYGARMDEALVHDGVIEFLRHAASGGHELFIISHKTRQPFAGPSYDLHRAARLWIERHLVWQGGPLVPMANIFFELTKADKCSRIAQCRCDAFVDDLPEILLADDFPATSDRWLFDPETHHATTRTDGLRVFRSWRELDELVNP